MALVSFPDWVACKVQSLVEIELLLLSKQKRHWVSLLVYFNHFMAPKAIYTETLCTISSWAMDPPGLTLEPPMAADQ